MAFRALPIVALSLVIVSRASAQQAGAPLTRQAAIEAALDRGARLGVARADTALARAQLLSARALPNPSLSASYSKSTPQYHVAVDLPIDFFWLRGTRVGAARYGQRAAQLRFVYERASIALDVDTTYTRALASRARAELSKRTAAGADSLRRMVAARRDAGDASDLDVELATVTAGQLANTAAADSLLYVSTVLALQSIIGFNENQMVVTPTDSLATPSDTAFSTGGVPVLVAAAEASLAQAQNTARLQRRSLLGSTSLTGGFETRDPGGTGNQILPTFGIALPLPFFDRNRGAIAEAVAGQRRAEAELTLARIESRTRITQALNERRNALARLARDRVLVTSATRLIAMSLTAYREGASALPNVLEAQRNARDVLAQYVDDLAALWTATASLRVYALTAQAGTAP
jgi:cobalt-zinc-cadmium efflux system outer membrane protein